MIESLKLVEVNIQLVSIVLFKFLVGEIDGRGEGITHTYIHTHILYRIYYAVCWSEQKIPLNLHYALCHDNKYTLEVFMEFATITRADVV